MAMCQALQNASVRFVKAVSVLCMLCSQGLPGKVPGEGNAE